MRLSKTTILTKLLLNQWADTDGNIAPKLFT